MYLFIFFYLKLFIPKSFLFPELDPDQIFQAFFGGENHFGGGFPHASSGFTGGFQGGDYSGGSFPKYFYFPN